MPLAQGHHPLL